MGLRFLGTSLLLLRTLDLGGGNVTQEIHFSLTLPKPPMLTHESLSSRSVRGLSAFNTWTLSWVGL